MRYQIILRPIGTNGVACESAVDADGNKFYERVVGNCPALVADNNLEVLQAVANATVQPSTEQKAGLIGYVAAIEEETDTETVESAVDALE
jgi:hypothetical protein